MNKYQSQRLGNINSTFSPKAHSNPSSTRRVVKKQTLPADYKSEVIEQRVAKKEKKCKRPHPGSNFNSLLVEHGFVEPEHAAKPKFSPYNPV